MQEEVHNQVTLPQDAACVDASSPVINALEKHLEKWYGAPHLIDRSEPRSEREQEGFVGLNKVP